MKLEQPHDWVHWSWHISMTIALLLCALWNWMKHNRNEKKMEHIDKIYRRMDEMNKEQAEMNGTLKGVSRGVDMLIQNQLDKDK